MNAPPVPKAALFPLRIEIDAGSYIVGTPASLYRKRGLIGVVATPALACLAAILIFIMYVDERTEAIEVGFASVTAVFSAVFIAYGLVLLAFAGFFARRTQIRFDRARRVVRRERDGFEVPWDAIALVRARPNGGGPLRFWCIELVGRDGSVVMPIHRRLAEPHGADIEATTEALRACLADAGYRSADAVGAEIPAVPRIDVLGASPNTAAMLCYLPIHGIFLLASIYYALTAHDRPFVRFAALQSLTQTAASTLVLLGIGAVAGPPAALLDDGPLRLTAIIVLVTLLVMTALANLGVHAYAAIQASKGRAWVMPWLRPIVMRWAPPGVE